MRIQFEMLDFLQPEFWKQSENQAIKEKLFADDRFKSLYDIVIKKAEKLRRGAIYASSLADAPGPLGYLQRATKTRFYVADFISALGKLNRQLQKIGNEKHQDDKAFLIKTKEWIERIHSMRHQLKNAIHLTSLQGSTRAIQLANAEKHAFLHDIEVLANSYRDFINYCNYILRHPDPDLLPTLTQHGECLGRQIDLFYAHITHAKNRPHGNWVLHLEHCLEKFADCRWAESFAKYRSPHHAAWEDISPHGSSHTGGNESRNSLKRTHSDDLWDAGSRPKKLKHETPTLNFYQKESLDFRNILIQDTSLTAEMREFVAKLVEYATNT